jgi:hypothetical protein
MIDFLTGFLIGLGLFSLGVVPAILKWGFSLNMIIILLSGAALFGVITCIFGREQLYGVLHRFMDF